MLVPTVPLPLDLSGGHCATGAARLPPQAWDEDAAAEDRELAAMACSWCPALEVCLSWRMSLPARKRPAGVVAGIFRADRPVSPRPARKAVTAGLATARAGSRRNTVAAYAGLATGTGTAPAPLAGSKESRYRATHRAAERLRFRRYLAEHPRDPEAERERTRKWRADHPGAARANNLRESARQRARRAAVEIAAGNPRTLAAAAGTAQRPAAGIGANARPA
jgi:hypothetical protein